MKSIKNVCQVLALLFGVGALVLFFTNFAAFTSNGEVINATGAQLSFGSSLQNSLGEAYSMAKSSKLLACFLLTALAVLFSALGFKFKKAAIAGPVFALAGGIFMLVVTLSDPWKFVDTRPLPTVTDVTYHSMVMFSMIALLLSAVVGCIAVLAADYVSAKASGKKTIPQRVVKFFREYKSEIKKIVWPGPRQVVKNTVVVIIVCLLIGGFIWLLDWGLGNLLNLILGIQTKS